MHDEKTKDIFIDIPPILYINKSARYALANGTTKKYYNS